MISRVCAQHGKKSWGRCKPFDGQFFNICKIFLTPPLHNLSGSDLGRMKKPDRPPKDMRLEDSHWAIYALKDIQSALCDARYDVARHHIADAIEAIVARDEQDEDGANGTKSTRNGQPGYWL